MALLAASSLALYLLYFYVPISTGHTQPLNGLRPLGDWSVGSPGGLAAFFGSVVAGLFALYVAGYRRVRGAPDGDPATRAVVYGSAAAISILLMFLPALLSKDVFDYMVQGRLLAVHRANPFQTPGDAFPSDEFVRAMGWPQFTTLYGPAWVSAAGILAFISPGTPAGALIVYKALFGLVHLLNGALIGALRRGRGLPALPGELLYLWNPLVLLQVAGDAHNDAFLMLWVLLGLFFLGRAAAASGLYEEGLGVVCLGVSILVKYITAPFLLLALAARLRRARGARGLLEVTGLGLTAAAVFVLGFVPYLRGMDAASLLRPYRMGHYQGGLLMVLSMAASHAWPSGAPGTLSQTANGIMVAASGILTALLAAWAVVVVIRIRRDEDIPRAGLLVILPYLLVVTALLRVSYGVWIVALAALLAAGPLRRAALLMSASLFALDLYWVYAIRAAAVPLAAGSPLPLHRIQSAATLVAVGIPILYLLAVSAGRRSGRSGAPGRGNPAWSGAEDR